MYVLRQKAKGSGFLYFVDFGMMGFPKMSSDIGAAHRFASEGEAEQAASQCAQTFEAVPV